jgi:crotonobetainyl-CoA:carnitine CoA-transferase CaiB-like acyl-CoA transferase
MGPFNLPWSTFLAFVVTGASVVAAIVWALHDRRRDGRA